MSVDEASERQNRAADPSASTWLSANAGSGKTRVLTDRVARLLLGRVPPQNILCLTYTKAAASEMQNRLFERLGGWAMRDDDALHAELSKLGIEGLDDRERLAEARRLFARAIETPGGLRIQTIHSFCASLLRRFPLEAGVTPNFTEMDDHAADKLRDEIVEALADGPEVATVDAIAAEYRGEDLRLLTRAVAEFRDRPWARYSERDIRGWFGVPDGVDEAGVLATAFDGTEADTMAAILPVLDASAKTTDRQAARKLREADFSAPTSATLDAAAEVLLNGAKTKEPYSAKIGSFPTQEVRAQLGGALVPLEALMRRIETAFDTHLRLSAVRRCVALHRFALAFLPAYAAAKERLGWVDFDDLILKTLKLLSDPAVADWVLYRLDGGLDHILVDEAQDTSPTQWQVIERLAQEFTSGQGVRDGVLRTIFVVGDQKQSIYSFQGADPAEFARMRRHFDSRLRGIGEDLRPLELEFSFRSSDAILRFVQNLFDGRGGPDLKMDTQHRAFHAAFPGRVDLWPAIPETEAPEDGPWHEPVDRRSDAHHDAVLARRIAETVRDLIGNETIPLQGGGRRQIAAGDFLILVRRRSRLFEEVIRACKSLKLPIAGADRLKLGAELAVKDLTALLQFLSISEDDLSLAAALRSPLFGWSEAELYDLAVGRDGFLWQALRKRGDAFPRTVRTLRDLRDAADYLRPYDLIERILIRHGGRRRLLARLGAEAEDGIDEMLSQALGYEQMGVPSLTGFLAWLETDEVEVKRQLDSAGAQIRVMTVHGAKGLESPIVILPDTCVRPVRDDAEIVTLDGDNPVWKMVADRQPEPVRTAMARRKAALEAEDLRLLYVAVTRAECWLIVCGAGKTAKNCWYSMANAALETTGAVRESMPTGEGLRYAHGDWVGGAVKDPEIREGVEPDMPEWASRKAAIPREARVLSPSDLGGAKALPGEGGQDEETAKRFGSQVHVLLEHLPATSAAERGDMARTLLMGREDAATVPEVETALAHVARVLEDPALAAVFAEDALAEVDVTAALPELGGQRMHGTIDRLIVGPDRVLAIDFKTNAVVPDRPQDTPEGLLRQMAAYAAALAQIYPDRRVDTAILWTARPLLMHLPHDIVRASLHSPATS